VLKELRHPWIPRALDYTENDREAMMIQTLFRGRSLADVRADTVIRPDLSGECRRAAWEAVVAAWGSQICQVLDYLHRCDPVLVYGDLKPENLILDPDGEIRLVDFGSVIWGDPPAGTWGTRGYAAPEQYAEEPGHPCPESDLYALGRILEELLAGTASASMRNILGRCLERDCRKRWGSAAEVGRRLNTIASLRRGEVFVCENW